MSNSINFATTPVEQLAVSAATAFVDAANAYAAVGSLSDKMDAIKHRASDLITEAIGFDDPDFLLRIVNHYFALATLIKAYDFSYPETCVLEHVEDTIDWLSNLC